MAEKDRKVPVNVSLAPRQNSIIDREAKKNGISYSEQLRRVVDEWIEKRPTLSSRLYGTAQQ